jgi:hypothetical protein
MKQSAIYATRSARVESKRRRDALETSLAKLIIAIMCFLVALGIMLWNWNG